MTRMRVAIGCTMALAASTMIAGCQTHSAGKAGGDTTVLTLATIDDVNDNGQSYGPQAFVDSLVTVSGGRFKVEVTQHYGNGSAQAESNLVKAIASGTIDGGWPSTRSFANAGIPGFATVEAPMTISSYAAEKELVSGPVAGELLRRLDGSGVVGLGLAVGPLRQPFATHAPLLAPADWHGVRFRVFNSPVQADTVTALGAVPVNIGQSWTEEVRSGNLRGAEFDIAQYAHNAYATEAGDVTANVVLWPKVFVLSLSKKRFDSLTSQQQGWVREAAAQAVKASADASYDDSTIAQSLCITGVRFYDASAAQIAALRSKVRPVLDKLAMTTSDAALLRAIQAIARRHPTPEPLNVPADCR